MTGFKINTVVRDYSDDPKPLRREDIERVLDELDLKVVECTIEEVDVQ